MLLVQKPKRGPGIPKIPPFEQEIVRRQEKDEQADEDAGNTLQHTDPECIKLSGQVAADANRPLRDLIGIERQVARGFCD
jgi:hypothetical protein